MTSALGRLLTGLLVTLAVLQGCGESPVEKGSASPASGTRSAQALEGGPRLAGVLMKDIWEGGGASSSSPAGLGEVNGQLVFSANDGTSGRELWTSDGTAAGTVRLLDLSPGASASSPSALTHTGAVTYFTADDGPHGVELWKTDGTAAGTVRLTDLGPGAASGLPSQLVPLRGKLYFTANHESNSGDLWMSDGTAAGTVLVKDISPPEENTAPLWDLTVVNDALYFSADDAVHGRELWTSDGTAAGTRLVKDVIEGPGGKRPTNLTAMNGLLYFTVDDGISGVEPWKSNGTEAGTTRVADLWPGENNSFATEFRVFNGLLYFTASSPVAIAEPWRTDGTAAGTVRLKSLQPAVPVPGFESVSNGAGTTFLAMDDGASGREIWKSDGSAAGTVRVTDLIRGAGSASPSDLTVAGNILYFTAEDETHGRELWRLAMVYDTTPPTVTCPVSVTAEAVNASGATVTYGTATASDDFTDQPVLTYSQASGARFPVGATQVQVTATDEVGNSASCTFSVTVRDTIAPALTCPANISRGSDNPQGESVTYPAPTATDAVTAAPVITVSHPSGSLFPSGTTRVTVTARDEANNTSTCSFTVTLRDSVAPVVICPDAIVAEATSAFGAPVSYPSPTATDNTSPPEVTASHPSGSTFPLNTTRVTLTATDAARNTATCSFTVTVRDTTAPALLCPADVSVTDAPAEGQAVTFPEASATDAASTATVSYSHASGSLFAPGTTQVTAQATDASGNVTTCSFQVQVEEAAPAAEPAPRDSGCAASGGAPLGLGWLALLLLSWSTRRRATSSLR